MTLPIHSDFNGLNWAFCGQPFCDVAVPPQVGSFHGLNTAFHGNPFAGTIDFRGALILESVSGSETTASVADIFFEPPESRTVTPVLKTLDIGYHGAPFVEGYAIPGIVFFGLEISWRGEPFVVTSVVLPTIIEIVPSAGITAATVVIGGITTVLIMSADSQMSVVGNCGTIEVINQDVIIVPIAGRVVVGGQYTGLIFSIPALPGEILTSASVVGTITHCVIISPPAESIATVGGVICLALPIIPAQVICSVVGAILGCVIVPSRAIITVTGRNQPVSSFLSTVGATRSYQAIITKIGMADLIVPIARLTSRQHITDPSFTEMTIPCLDQLSDILERIVTTGSTITLWGILATPTAILQRESLFSAPIETVVIFGNGSSQSITLSGYGVNASPSIPAIYPLSGVTYRSIDRSTLTLRTIATDFCLRTGDTVTYDGDSITAGNITYTMDALLGISIDIREAE